MISIIVKTKYKNTDVILVGIVHNSPISFERVKGVMDKYANTPILLEYCERRLQTNISRGKTPAPHIFWDTRGGKTLLSISNIFWNTLAKTRLIIEEYVVRRCWEEKRELILIDQDVKETLKEICSPLGLLIDFIRKLFYTPTIKLTPEEIEFYESLTYNDICKLKLSEVDQKRDRIMAENIKSYIDANKSEKIIVIVGKGHIPGIIKHLA